MLEPRASCLSLSQPTRTITNGVRRFVFAVKVYTCSVFLVNCILHNVLLHPPPLSLHVKAQFLRKLYIGDERNPDEAAQSTCITIVSKASPGCIIH